MRGPGPHPEQMCPLQRMEAISCHSTGTTLRLTAPAFGPDCVAFSSDKRGRNPFQEKRNQKSPGQTKTTENHIAHLGKMYLFFTRKPSLYPHQPSHWQVKQSGSEQKSGATASIFLKGYHSLGGKSTKLTKQNTWKNS